MDIESHNPEPQPEKPDFLRFIFFNKQELRPGWRIATAVALYVAILFSSGFLLRPLARHLPRGFAPSTLILGEALQFLILVLVTWILSKIERRNMGEYGLPLRGSKALSRFARGFVFWGFLPLSLLLLVLRAFDSFYFGNFSLHGWQIFYWAGVWGLCFVLVGLFEEYSVRGYLLYTLADGIGFWPAAVVLAALFGILHTPNSGESRIGVVMTVFFAMFAALILRYSGNLWLAVGAHAGWDWGQSYFYGVSDSGFQAPGHLLNPHLQGRGWLNGGSVGPEGSILCLVLMVVLSVLFVRLYRKPRAPVLVVNQTP